MKKAFFKSIRFQIILLYIFILSLTLIILRSVLYADFRHTLQSELDAKIRLKVDGLEKGIRTYWQTQRLKSSKGSPDTFLFFQKKDQAFEQIAHQLIVEKLSRGEDIPTISFIFDAKGGLIVSSQRIAQINNFKKQILLSALNKTTRFDTLQLQLFNNRSIPVRVVSKPILQQNKVKYVVVVVTSLIPLNKALNQLKTVFFLQIPLILLIAIAGALFLVQATLSPVDEMVSTIGQINSETLKLRIKVPKTNDEIARLAETFNGMLAKLEKSFSSQRQIVQDISHELKTPLTILQGQQEVILKKDRDIDEYKDVLLSNLQEIEKMKQIVNNLLLLAKFDKEDLLLKMSGLNLNGLVHKICEDIKVLAMEKKINVQILDHDKNMIVSGHEAYLSLALNNVLGNAVKYTQKGSITITIKKFKNLAHIEINDTGIGISAEHLPYIFDRFYRVDKVRSSGEGFGLGLSIAKSILDLHKGGIHVRSQLHQGTTFTIYLPLVS